MSSIEPYRKKYRSQYLCGQSDVNDDRNQLGDSYATDMYLSMYYITPKRQMENKFTMPFHPPQTGALTLFGTATNIPNVEDLIQQQQTRFVFEAIPPLPSICSRLFQTCRRWKSSAPTTTRTFWMIHATFM